MVISAMQWNAQELAHRATECVGHVMSANSPWALHALIGSPGLLREQLLQSV